MWLELGLFWLWSSGALFGAAAGERHSKGLRLDSRWVTVNLLASFLWPAYAAWLAVRSILTA